MNQAQGASSEFEKLQADQQEKVLQFVGVTNCEDLNVATQYMAMSNFDLNVNDVSTCPQSSVEICTTVFRERYSRCNCCSSTSCASNARGDEGW
jgi:uncharacterized protein YuzB (UPF0349 family)